MNRAKFWFSSKQKHIRMKQSLLNVYMIFDNGDIREYTEMVSLDSDSPDGIWDDYEFIGEGEYLGPKTSEGYKQALKAARGD